MRKNQIIVEIDVSSLSDKFVDSLYIDSNIDRFYKTSVLVKINGQTKILDNYNDYSHRILNPANILHLTIKIDELLDMNI